MALKKNADFETKFLNLFKMDLLNMLTFLHISVILPHMKMKETLLRSADP
jgi:hypothetical protein